MATAKRVPPEPQEDKIILDLDLHEASVLSQILGNHVNGFGDGRHAVDRIWSALESTDVPESHYEIVSQANNYTGKPYLKFTGNQEVLE